MPKNTNSSYPDTYLHVEECRSGETFIQPIRGNELLDINRLVKKWIKINFGGAFKLDGGLTSRLPGQFYARIMTDNRPPESMLCWTSGGFYVKGYEE